jgi:hypothetical protein
MIFLKKQRRPKRFVETSIQGCDADLNVTLNLNPQLQEKQTKTSFNLWFVHHFSVGAWIFGSSIFNARYKKPTSSTWSMYFKLWFASRLSVRGSTCFYVFVFGNTNDKLTHERQVEIRTTALGSVNNN